MKKLRNPVKDLPHLLRFLALHLALGAAVGVAFASLVVLSNFSGIKDLIATSEQPYFVLFLLWFMNALTFASLAMGIGVMTLPRDEETCDMRAPGYRREDIEKRRSHEGRRD